jgi:pilus assembly protein Flp/PilA
VPIIARFFRDSSGASAAEYALLLAIFGAGLGFAVYQIGIEQSAAIVRTADNILAVTSGSLSGSPVAVAGQGDGGQPAKAAARGNSAQGNGGGNPSGNGKGGKAKGGKASHSRNSDRARNGG